MALQDLQRTLDRVEGSAASGTVSLRDFDQGLVETLGATIPEVAPGSKFGGYYLVDQIPGLAGPQGEPGVPVHFGYPEDQFANFRMPCVVVSRDDITAAPQRKHPGTRLYRVPARTGLPTAPVQGVSGFSHVTERQQSEPYDITYAIYANATLRGGFEKKVAANAMLEHILRIFPTYGAMYLKDSLGDVRSYEAFNDGIMELTDVIGVSDRLVQFVVTVRVEAELDLSPEKTYRTATQHPTAVFGRI